MKSEATYAIDAFDELTGLPVEEWLSSPKDIKAVAKSLGLCVKDFWEDNGDFEIHLTDFCERCSIRIIGVPDCEIWIENQQVNDTFGQDGYHLLQISAHNPQTLDRLKEKITDRFECLAIDN
ncbi:hypothetical protein [Octadecabacter sp. R77987]|uniref:hypothetical protein n=1 Tax=Octadecabacter sp. R77987 TaxID=3093874 RepID=UPI00367167AD